MATLFKNLLQSQALRKFIADGSEIHVVSVCPRRYRTRGAVLIGNNRDAFLISTLLKIGCPPAILFAVILIAIFSVQSRAFWALSHVAQEICKLAPRRIECNSPAAVVLVANTVLISAPKDHVVPAAIRRRVSVAARVSVDAFVSAAGRATSTAVSAIAASNISRLGQKRLFATLTSSGYSRLSHAVHFLIVNGFGEARNGVDSAVSGRLYFTTP